jgi:hypothetical protein
MVWKVDTNSGARVNLVAGDQRKQIWRPQKMSREEFFRALPEGSLIDDTALKALFLLWE